MLNNLIFIFFFLYKRHIRRHSFSRAVTTRASVTKLTPAVLTTQNKTRTNR